MTDKILIDRAVLEQVLEFWNEGKGLALGELLQKALEQPPVEQPAMTLIAQRKLDDLLTRGYEVSGYSVYHEKKHQHGFVTGAGLVGWWKADGAEYPQPQVEQEPVAWQGRDGYLYHFIEEPKPGDRPLYTHPQPKRKPLTDEQIKRIDANTHFHESPDWSVRFARAIERAHGIGEQE